MSIDDDIEDHPWSSVSTNMKLGGFVTAGVAHSEKLKVIKTSALTTCLLLPSFKTSTCPNFRRVLRHGITKNIFMRYCTNVRKNTYTCRGEQGVLNRDSQ